jgi:PI-3-kinase-related kinase SMG-1
MYFNKMAPALKDAGITNGLGSRREWPMHVKQAVFQELLAETPKWLIAKEIS